MSVDKRFEIIDERRSERVVVDFIETAYQRQDSSLPEERQKGVAEARQGNLPGKRGKVLQKRCDRSMNVLAPVAASNEDGRDIQFGKAVATCFAA